MRCNCPYLHSFITFIALCYVCVRINIESEFLMVVKTLFPFIRKYLIMKLLHFAPKLFCYKRAPRKQILLIKAKSIIIPLESSKQMLQVHIATETINTKKGGFDY